MSEGEGNVEDLPELHERLEAYEREEEWALIRLLAWIALLAFIVAVLLFSPVPWGALVGLAVWSLGAKSVYSAFTELTATTHELRGRIHELERRARAG